MKYNHPVANLSNISNNERLDENTKGIPYVKAINELAPCPFCGSTYLNTLELDLNSWAVECVNCQATGPLKVSMEEAARVWGRTHQIEKNKDVLREKFCLAE